MTTVVRRRLLGMSSAKGICKASTTGIQWCRSDLGIPDDDMYIRWGCTANLPNHDSIVINSAKAIHRVADKLGFRRILEEAELCPKTWFSIQEWLRDPDTAETIVVRSAHHAQGRNLLLYTLEEEVDGSMALDGFIKKHPQYYISEYIPKVAEYRVFVVSGRAVCVAEKTPADKDTIAWNVAKGGRFDNVRWNDWNVKAVRVAIEAFNLSGLDFGGVDIMVDADGNCTVLEINSAPSLTSPYRQQCLAKGLDYIVKHGKEDIPLVNELGGYKKFIHPEVCDMALIKLKEVA